MNDLPLHVSGNNNVLHLNFYINYFENNNGNISSNSNIPSNNSNTTGENTAASKSHIQHVDSNADQVPKLSRNWTNEEECKKYASNSKKKAEDWAKKPKQKMISKKTNEEEQREKEEKKNENLSKARNNARVWALANPQAFGPKKF